MSSRGDASHPDRGRLRLPLPDQVDRSLYQLVRETPVFVLPRIYEMTPPGITPNAEGASLFGALQMRNRLACRPLFARFKRQAGASQELGCLPYGVLFYGPRQGRQVWLLYGFRSAVEGADEELHVPRVQRQVILHLRLLFVA